MEQKRGPVRVLSSLLSRVRAKLGTRVFVALCGVLALVIVSGAVWLWFATQTVDNRGIALKGMRKDYESLKKQEPKSERSDDKAAYYQLLASRAAGAQDYDGAIKAFEDRHDVLGDKMPAGDFTELATYYCRMDDKQGAIEALRGGAQLNQASDSDKSRLAAGQKIIDEQGCRAWLQPLDQE